VTAAFAETVKSTEPFTTVAIGFLLLRESVSLRTYLTLIPICFGVAFSCYHDDMFNLRGFLLAFASNFGFSLRAVLAKRLNLFHGERIDDIVMFFYISIQGLIYLIPITILFERDGLYQTWINYTHNRSYSHSSGTFGSHSPGIQFEPGSIGSYIGLVGLFVLNGTMFALYNLVSYLVLRRTDLVTHSVLNAFRRVFIILFTTFYFHLSLSPFNVLGVCIAVMGVLAFGYSKAKDNKM
jgi:drug/metabolite transporter (DMT)-like permease